MPCLRHSQRGFSLNELLLVMAAAATVMAMAVPVMTDVTEGARLNGAARELEREFQTARLKSVTANRILRVRLNCPGAGSYRTVEYLNSAADTATNRCNQTAYPFPADDDLMTRPNYDGPLRTLPLGATVNSEIIEFHPDGSAYRVVSNVLESLAAPVTITVTRKSRTKAMTINAAGKIQLQQ
jgi:prepilin-type N-terminal cleavage/methylation domain-containing protein